MLGLANGLDCKTLFVPGFMFDLQTFIFCFVQMLGLDAEHIYSFDWMTLCLRENVFKNIYKTRFKTLLINPNSSLF